MASTDNQDNVLDNSTDDRNTKLEKVYKIFDELCQCPICLKLLVEPITTICGHNYCLSCLKHLLASSNLEKTCPLCRENLSYLKNSRITINFILRNLLETRYENQYLERIAEIKQDVLDNKDKISVIKRLLIGNYHATINTGYEIGAHRWTLFIRFADDENDMDIGTYIKEIIISDPATQEHVLDAPPYRYTMTGLQSRTICLNIEFHSRFHKANLRTDWNLCFTGIGNQKSIELEFIN
ncbi:unnamed protein product [Didymodactylos carnosus]|uniref:RING-type domain-containing protein n=1 Tax=Didymodactylos carnosus TaxID=1234261 RepID=A0A813V460_9BILA|nr:unnamed protein product [Didymodactylos carnosus]CAF1061354.1 unnamed protein product [Didymodactylos carnosus]CAF3622077.1 unnamed protein product [Didymodactylos carnosus]CAF3826841.1 unnamed protein product [Didymodactylos carnosus]